MNLDQFGVFDGETTSGISLADIENKETLLSLVQIYANYLQTESLAVASSLFVKHYAVVVAASSLQYYEFQQQQHSWFSSAQLDRKTFRLYVADEQALPPETNWKQTVFPHLEQIINTLSAEYKVLKKILWENVAVRLNLVLQLNKATVPEEKLQLIFKSLTTTHVTWLTTGINPIANYCTRIEENRKTCCRYYQLEKKEEGLPYCLICPLKKGS